MSRSLLYALVAVLAAALLLPGAAPAAKKKPSRKSEKSFVVKSSSYKKGVYRFRVRGKKGRRIVRAKLRVGHVKKRVSAERVRRAVRRHRKLRARLPRSKRAVVSVASRRRGRLVITTVRKKRKKRHAESKRCCSEPVKPSSSCAAVGTFSTGRWPAACWRPYSDASPFNQRIPERPTLAPGSAQMVSKVTGFGQPNNLVAGSGGDDWQHPTYYGTSGDPLYTIHCVESWGRCGVEGAKIRIPAPARAASADDGHMTVVDQASGWEYDFWQVKNKPVGGGRLDISWGGRVHIRGNGLGSDATAARFGNLAGVIRAQEMVAGQINHALFMVVNCDSGDYVYPAMKSGRDCASIGQGNGDAAPMGSRFQLDMSSGEIEDLNVPRYKKTILHAMAEYGMYIGDTGGGSWGLQFESSATYSSFGYRDPLESFGARAGLPQWEGNRVFDVKSGVDWTRRLRVIAPCETSGTC